MIKNNNKSKAEKIKVWTQYLAEKTEEDYTTLYIHIPYCTQKCSYCEYFSKITNEVSDTYIDYLEEQFKEVSPVFKGEKISAINFGGGTPNTLSAKQLKRVLDMVEKYWDLEISDDNEMGFEFNPYHMTDEYIEVLKNSFINRLSMGIQSFNRDVIENENRLYTSKERVKEIYDACKSWTKMINVDLLAGLNGQTSEILREDVRALLEIGVEVITIYELNRIGDRNNAESTRKNINDMLLDMYHEFDGYPNYRYVGTTDEQFEHCNRYYKLGNTFKTFYNPAPQGFNNIIAFSIDDDIEIYPYSHFIPINKAYQRLSKKKTHFYNMDSRKDRPWWNIGFNNRKDK
jgi:coproporphyrinogen III oxidase-like Fe-S oxidoreductase